MWFFKNFEEVDIELAELRQRHNQALESMNKTVIPENPEADQTDVEEGKNDTEKWYWKNTLIYLLLFFIGHTTENSGYVFLNWWESEIFVFSKISFSEILTNGWELGQNRLSLKARYFILENLKPIFSVRIRLEHQIRELEYEKKKLIGDFEEQIEVLKTDKKNLEKSTAELKEELEGRDQVCCKRIYKISYS